MTKDEIFKRAFDILKEESDFRWDDIIDYITEYNIDENLDEFAEWFERRIGHEEN